MRLIFALALLALAPNAHADDLTCTYNAAKFLPVFKAAVVSFINTNVKFEWNKDSLKVSCAKGFGNNSDAEEGCAVTFSAKDGTPFYLHDDIQTYTDANNCTQLLETSDNSISVMMLSKNQATDDEGNYQGPITCTALVYNPVIVNKKSKVELTLPDGSFPDVTYQQ